MQIYTQKLRTDKHDLHEAQAKILVLQKVINKLKTENGQVREKYRRMHEIIDNTAFRNQMMYQESKNLCERINDIANEHRKTIESVKNLDQLIDSQEWLIGSYIEATKEFKRYIAKQDNDFRKDIEDAKLKISKFKNLNNSAENQLSAGFSSSGTGEIQSQEYTRDLENDFNLKMQNEEIINIKHRLLNENRESYTDLIVIQNSDDDLIEDHNISSFVLENSKQDFSLTKEISSYYNSNPEINQEQID